MNATLTHSRSKGSRIKAKSGVVFVVSNLCDRAEAIDESLSILPFCTSRKTTATAARSDLSRVPRHPFLYPLRVDSITGVLCRAEFEHAITYATCDLRLADCSNIPIRDEVMVEAFRR